MKRLFTTLAAAALLTACGPASDPPPYSDASIRVGRDTVAGPVEEWSDAGDGQIRVKIEGTVYFINPADIIWKR